MRPALLAALVWAMALPVSAETGPSGAGSSPAQTGSVGPPQGPAATPPSGPRPTSRRESTVCVTARGSCAIGSKVPLNTPCRCDIPGFGLKRGAAM